MALFFKRLFIICFVVIATNQVHSQPNNGNSNAHQSQPNQNIAVPQPLKVALEPDQQEIESEKGYKARQEERDQSNALWNKIGLLVNGFLFVLVLIQSIFSYRALIEAKNAVQASQRQADASEKALKATREHFNLTERPAIGLDRIFWDRREDGFLLSKIVMVNSGKIYAEIIEQSTWFGDLMDVPEGFWNGTAVPEPGEPLISPNKTGFMHANAKREVVMAWIHPAQMQELDNKSRAVLLWLKLRYKGRTSKIYTFESYVLYDPDIRGFKDCPTHNYAD
jgi:hypothetical protein